MGESSWGEALGFGAMMMGGMGMQAGAGYATASVNASAATQIAETNAGAWRYINDSNNTTREEVARINANSATTQTEWQVAGMIFAAQTQYNQSVMQMQYIDMQDRRQALNFRHQLDSELRMMTLGYNAQIHSLNLQHQETMTQLNNEHEESLAELFVGAGEQIDPATLLI